MTRRLEPKVTSPSGKTRLGKGFSLAELSSAGISIDSAHRLLLPIDKRRSSSREENILAIKGLLPSAKPAKRIGEIPTEPKLRAKKKEPISAKPVEEIKTKEVKTRKRKKEPVSSKPAEEPKPTTKPAKPRERKSAAKRRKSGSSGSKE